MQPLVWTGSQESAMKEIRKALQELPRITIDFESENYLHAEARSRIFRFVDDMEFLVDMENQLIHFRSASRVGYSDLGANRARMEKFVEAFKKGTKTP